MPQFYLREWSEDKETIWAYRVDGSPAFRTSTRAVACERGLYRHPTSDKVSPNRTDDIITRIEGIYSSVWPGIIDRAENPLTRRNIARFIALMAFRHPHQKGTIRDVHAKFRRLAEEMRPEHKLEVVFDTESAACSAGEVLQWATEDDAAITSAFLMLMPDLVEAISEVLCKRRWGVVFSEAPAFLTSDFPVFLSRGTARKRSFGFGTPGTQVFFPVCPTRMLVITDEWDHEFAHYRLTRHEVFNRRVAQGAVQFIFGHAQVVGLENRIREWRTTA